MAWTAAPPGAGCVLLVAMAVASRTLSWWGPHCQSEGYTLCGPVCGRYWPRHSTGWGGARGLPGEGLSHARPGAHVSGLMTRHCTGGLSTDKGRIDIEVGVLGGKVGRDQKDKK